MAPTLTSIFSSLFCLPCDHLSACCQGYDFKYYKGECCLEICLDFRAQFNSVILLFIKLQYVHERCQDVCKNSLYFNIHMFLHSIFMFVYFVSFKLFVYPVH